MRRIVARLALAGVVVIVAVELALLVFRPEAGVAGILQVLAPHLAIAGMLVVPLCLLERRTAATVASVILAVVLIVRFGDEWFSLPAAAPPSDAIRLHVVTWNLEVGSRPGVDSAGVIRGVQADVVALQELRPNAAAAIDTDGAIVARYPYRVLVPRDDVGGMGLLSRFPISGPTFRVDPVVQEATLDLGGGRQLAVVNAHPFHADFAGVFSGTNLPTGLDPSRRNADLVGIRDGIGALIAGGLPVLMLGDLNTAASEPAFDRFVNGLRDVHREVGLGSGWTWRPIRLEFLGFGLVAIDHVIVSPDIDPLSIAVTCPQVGDHCLVQATLAVPAHPGG
jgi:endonuclease/exonuclease/phosphatase (EEP) superfamily protein YafD